MKVDPAIPLRLKKMSNAPGTKEELMIKTTKVSITSCLLLILSLTLIYLPAFGDVGKPISVGETLEEFVLNPPKSAEEREYLGLKNEEPFKLSQLPAKLVLIEIFSTL